MSCLICFLTHANLFGSRILFNALYYLFAWIDVLCKQKFIYRTLLNGIEHTFKFEAGETNHISKLSIFCK